MNVTGCSIGFVIIRGLIVLELISPLRIVAHDALHDWPWEGSVVPSPFPVPPQRRMKLPRDVRGAGPQAELGRIRG